MKCDGHVESSGHAGALYISSLQAGLKEAFQESLSSLSHRTAGNIKTKEYLLICPMQEGDYQIYASNKY